MPLAGLAVAHHWLGDDDAALAWLERAIDARDYCLIIAPLRSVDDPTSWESATRVTHASRHQMTELS
jgi:hypothetical protein